MVGYWSIGDSSETGKMISVFSVEAAEVIRNRRLPFYVTRILTGRSFINQHQYSFEFVPTTVVVNRLNLLSTFYLNA